MWECGLKLQGCLMSLDRLASLLMWECGLKLEVLDSLGGQHVVTPYVGVWIETFFGRALQISSMSLLMWECGLKL